MKAVPLLFLLTALSHAAIINGSITYQYEYPDGGASFQFASPDNALRFSGTATVGGDCTTWLCPVGFSTSQIIGAAYADGIQSSVFSFGLATADNVSYSGDLRLYSLSYQFLADVPLQTELLGVTRSPGLAVETFDPPLPTPEPSALVSLLLAATILLRRKTATER